MALPDDRFTFERDLPAGREKATQNAYFASGVSIGSVGGPYPEDKELVVEAIALKNPGQKLARRRQSQGRYRSL